MTHEQLKTGRLFAAVSSIEIFRPKTGPEFVYLHTNMPNPRSPYVGGLAFQVTLDRGTAQDWVHTNFPGVETHMYDFAMGQRIAHNPARLQGVKALEDGTLVASGD